MTDPDSARDGADATAARLRQLLAELRAPTVARDDPRAAHQLELCREVESILLEQQAQRRERRRA